MFGKSWIEQILPRLGAFGERQPRGRNVRANEHRRQRLRLQALEGREVPAAVTVTNVYDVADGNTSSIDALNGDPGLDGTVSLREAILASNNTPGANTITFNPGPGAPDMHIILTQGELAIFNAVTITGQEEGTTTLDGDHKSRIFRTNSIPGGFPALPLTLDRLALINGDTAKDVFTKDGGAIWAASGGLLTVTRCTISGNSAVSGDGGGISSVNGPVTVSDSTISGNKASFKGGGIWSNSSVTVTGSTVIGNSAVFGGGIYASSIFGRSADVTVNDSTISGNRALAPNGLFGYGGGIGCGGQTTVSNSTISGNVAGSGGGVDGYLVTVSNSTFSGNSANYYGGGIEAYSVAVSNSTISGNSANLGGGIYTNGYDAEIRSSIVAGNSANGGSPDLTGTPTVTNSIIGGDPMLGSLADNGGTTKTMALLTGSPAIDGGSNPDNLSNDQRGPGYVRQSGSSVDIGAYEFQFPTNQAPADIALAPADVPENQPAGTAVGDFTTTDPDSGDQFTYTLVGGDGSADNGSFLISGSTLQTAASFDFEAKAFYSIRVKTTDAGGLAFEKTLAVRVTNVNEKPTLSLPTSQSAFEDVGKVISGITVGDPDGGSLTVTLAVRHGGLTLRTTTGLSVSGNGSGVVSLSGSIANLNAALASLIYCGDLNYTGADLLSVSANDGSLSAIGEVGLTVKSVAQQARDMQSQVSALRAARVLNQGQANMLNSDLNLKGNYGDIGKVQQFLSDVATLRNAGVLTQAQAEALLGSGNTLLISVSRH